MLMEFAPQGNPTHVLNKAEENQVDVSNQVLITTALQVADAMVHLALISPYRVPKTRPPHPPTAPHRPPVQAPARTLIHPPSTLSRSARAVPRRPPGARRSSRRAWCSACSRPGTMI